MEMMNLFKQTGNTKATTYTLVTNQNHRIGKYQHRNLIAMI